MLGKLFKFLWFPVMWAVVMPLTWTMWYNPETHTERVAVEERIEDAVSGQEFQNAFVQFEWRSGLFSWGGAGAGGIGAAVFWAVSPEDFVQELNPNEKIYTALQRRQDVRYPTVEKVYIAGVENRSLLLGYRDLYPAPEYTSSIYLSDTEIVFSTKHTHNFDGVILLTLLGSILLGFAWLVGAVSSEDYS